VLRQNAGQGATTARPRLLAAAGGVGDVSVQLARALGGQGYATASSRDHALVMYLSATPIDYRARSVEQYVESITQGAGHS